VSKLLSSDTPTIKVPFVGQTFSTATPTIKWEDFFSPEYRSFESRGVWIAAWGPSHWETYIPDPNLTDVTVGTGGHGDRTLVNGRYSFVVGFREVRKFGDLQLARQSFRSAPAYIKHE
jgi:hypothetical protein